MASELHKKPPVSKDFPLAWHKGSGQFYKKYQRRFIYFGSDPSVALRKYLAEKDYYIAGVPVPADESFSVRKLCNHFLHKKERDKDAGTITLQTYTEYTDICKVIAKLWGDRAIKTLRPIDFGDLKHALTTGSPNVLRRKIVIARSVFKFGFTSGLLEQPVRYGDSFALPSKTESRKHRSRVVRPILDAATIATMLEAASPQMKACIYLGINCGFYAKDCSDLRVRHIEGEFISFAREKTGIDRRVWLWPETRAAIAASKAPANDEGRVLLSRTGQPLHRHFGATRSDLIASQWTTLKGKINLKRENSGFKCLRHTYRTVADACGDQPAVGLTMGHTDSSVADNYRHGIADEQLVKVSQFVRNWLFKAAE